MPLNKKFLNKLATTCTNHESKISSTSNSPESSAGGQKAEGVTPDEPGTKPMAGFNYNT